MDQGQPPSTITEAVTAALKERSLHLGAALTVCLFMTLALMPVVGVFAGSFTPAPISYFYVRRGRVFGLTMVGLAAVLVGVAYLASGRPLGWLLFMEYALLGVALAEGLIWRFPASKVVGYSTVAVLGLALTVLTVNSLAQGQAPWTFARKHVEAQVRFSMVLYQAVLTGNMPAPQSGASSTGPKVDLGPTAELENGETPLVEGYSEEQRQEAYTRDPSGTDQDLPGREFDPAIDQTSREMEPLIAFLVRIFPGLTIMATLLLVMVNFVTVQTLLIRAGSLAPDRESLRRWRTPDSLVWAVVGFGFGAFLGEGIIQAISFNGLLIAGLVYFFQGLCIVAFWMARKKAPMFVRVLVYSLIAIQIYLILIIAVLGLFDLWFDFRRLKAAPPEA